MSTLSRVTQQYAEILAQNTSNARITQQYIEVLLQLDSGTTYFESANSSCNITDNVVVSVLYSLTDTLNITDNVIFNADTTHVVSDTLNITDNVAYNPSITENVSDTLSITDNATLISIRSLSVNDALSITDNVSAIVPKTYSFIVEQPISLLSGSQKINAVPISTNTSLGLLQTVRSALPFSVTSTFSSFYDEVQYIRERNGWPLGNTLNITHTVQFEATDQYFLYDTLNITDNVTVQRPYRETLQNKLFLSHSASASYGVRNFSITDTLVLKSYTPITPNLTSTLNLTDEALRRIWPISSLGVTDNVVVGKTKTVEECEIELTHNIHTSSIFRRALTTNLGLLSSVTYFNASVACLNKSYTPFLGGKNNPVPTALPAQKRDASENRVILAWPNIDSPISQIILRAPEIDNIYRYSVSRSYKEARGGTLYVYRDPSWPKYSSLIVTFVGLTQNEAIDYQDFLYETMGKEIELGDWHGNIWRGIIINPDEPIVCDSKRGYTVSFQFDGLQQVANLTYSDVNLSDAAEFELIYGLTSTISVSDTLGSLHDNYAPVTQTLEITDVPTSCTI